MSIPGRRLRSIRRWAVSWLALATGAAAAIAGAPRDSPQSQVPRFQAEIRLVEVDVVVTDAAGRVVRGLTKDDFEVYEAGHLRPVSAFTFVDLPVTPADAAGLPLASPDVATNARTDEERLYVLVLDDLHTRRDRAGRVVDTARRFVARLDPADYAAVVFTSGQVSGAQEPTRDRLALARAIDQFQGWLTRFGSVRPAGGSGRGIDQVNFGLLRELGGGRGVPFTPMPGDPFPELTPVMQASTMLRTMREAAGAIESLGSRRKTIVLFGEGLPLDLNEIADNPVDHGTSGLDLILRKDLEDFVRAAVQAHVSVYPIDSRGPTRLSEENFGESPSWLTDQGRIGRESLQWLAARTGGVAAVGTLDFDGAVDRVMREASTYYLLGFEPDPERRGNAFRKIEVKVKQPGLTVRARAGYWPGEMRTRARAAGKLSAIDAALAGALPSGDLPLAATAAAFRAGKGKDASVALALEVAMADADPAAPSSRVSDIVQLGVIAVAADGKVALRQGRTARFTLRRGTDSVRVRYQLVDRLALPPGRYQVRVAAESEQLKKAGSVFLDVEVPDFARLPLSLGGPVFAYAPPPPVPTAEVERLGGLLPVVPTVARELEEGRPVEAMVRVYRGAGTKPAPARVVARVTSDADTEVWRREDAIPAERFGRTSAGVDYRVDLPLAALEPARYVLAIEVWEDGADGPAARRAVPFRVVPATAMSAVPVAPAAVVDPLLAQARAYVAWYIPALASVVAEERYEQILGTRSGGSRARRLVSDFLLVQAPNVDGWLPFRDVIEVDGRPVRQRNDRLLKLFTETPASAVARAEEIVAESARYNLGAARTINVPTLALLYLRPGYPYPADFQRAGREKVGDVETVVLKFSETAEPTLIKDRSGRDLPADVEFAIDPATGRVLRTRLLTERPGTGSTGRVSGEIVVTYRFDGRLGLFVPSEMREQYEQGTLLLRGTARYSHFRQFRVAVNEEIQK